ncbi:MAG: 3-isopropylmalate dehydratase small subunit [Chloroflexi bacterium]|nr:3-isopropylmalate dehydratase small subunit [Chloroflexota bacterium]
MPEPVTAFRSRAIPLPNENVDTDQIIPARYLKTTEKSGLADGLFSNWRYAADGTARPDFVLNRPEMQGRAVLLAGANFGAGSSREHAPWALLSWGIRAVISTGFADIFRANALKNGLLPVAVSPERHTALFDLVAADPDVEFAVDLSTQTVGVRPAHPDAPAVAKAMAVVGDSFAFEIDPFARRMLLDGTDEIGYVLARLPSIEAWEAASPAPVNTLE